MQKDYSQALYRNKKDDFIGARLAEGSFGRDRAGNQPSQSSTGQPTRYASYGTAASATAPADPQDKAKDEFWARWKAQALLPAPKRGWAGKLVKFAVAAGVVGAVVIASSGDENHG